MGEPDEALLWARKSIVKPSLHTAMAHGYRAGAAASAARIKALEAVVRKLILLHDTPTRPGNTYEVARALLKEADQ